MRSMKSELHRVGLVQPVKQAEAKKDTRKNKKRNERLSERDLLDFMGVDRDTYRRGLGGAFRRK
ncbi:hypothetical protein [Sporosarcina obsidiansis]|uniref:hypothetical protein n=1 Tax=Sporosarcina obsidiansis TaxID=2660748 RepID=UPI00129B4FDF|nr:hypothetical protein [Sporosarcina obsidiansis]